MSLTVGQMLNQRYRIEARLGQGGYGAVYRAWDTQEQRPAALKENLLASIEAQRQFNHAAAQLQGLAHPNLSRFIDHFAVANKGLYLVCEFVEGESLAQMLERQGGPLLEAQALAWLLPVCDALIYLHSQNPPALHRDVRPANIIIHPDGRPVLVDLGIASPMPPGSRP